VNLTKKLTVTSVAVAFVALTLLAPLSARASSASNVTITQIAIDPAYGNFVFIALSAVPTGRPGCSSSGSWYYTFPFSGTIYKEMYSTLLAAMMSGKLISTTGAGVCNESGTVETLRGFNVVN
jgi:hypothetical protein